MLRVPCRASSLPRTSVDVEDWTERLQEIIEKDQIAVDALSDVAAPDPIPWDEIALKHDPDYTTYKQMQVTQIIKHIVCMMDKRPEHKQVIKRAIDSFFLHLRVYKYSTFLDCIVDGKLKERFDHDLYTKILRIHYPRERVEGVIVFPTINGMDVNDRPE